MTQPRPDSDPATVGDLRRFLKRLKLVEGEVADLWEKMAAEDDRLTQNVDEAIDKADRAQRAVRRLKKEWDNSE